MHYVADDLGEFDQAVLLDLIICDHVVQLRGQHCLLVVYTVRDDESGGDSKSQNTSADVPQRDGSIAPVALGAAIVSIDALHIEYLDDSSVAIAAAVVDFLDGTLCQTHGW